MLCTGHHLLGHGDGAIGSQTAAGGLGLWFPFRLMRLVQELLPVPAGFGTPEFHALGELDQQVILHMISNPGTLICHFQAIKIVGDRELATMRRLEEGPSMEARLDLQGATTASVKIKYADDVVCNTNCQGAAAAPAASPQGLGKGG